jgi:hypothetical protein
LLLPTSFLQNSHHIAKDARGPAINVSNSGGGRSRTYQQHRPGGPPSTSPTPVVATAGPTDSTPQGVHHRRLQLWWWPLSDLPPAPPGGLPSTPPTLVVAAAGPTDSTPRGARHRHLQLRWWPLLDLSTAPLGGLPSTSPNSLVATTGPATSTPWGPTIDIFNVSGGRSRTCRQHPQGACRRRLQLQW